MCDGDRHGGAVHGVIRRATWFIEPHTPSPSWRLCSSALGAGVGLGQAPGTGPTLATISVLVMNEASGSRGVPAVGSTSSQEVVE